MKFTPKTEEEIQYNNLLKPGSYDFEVIQADETLSQAGNEMIKMTLKVWDENGNEHLIYDYLLESLAYKLRHFALYTGLGDLYEAGKISSSDCLNRLGKAQIIVQKGKEKSDNKGEFYPDRNSVKDYIKVDELIKQVSITKKEDDFFNDDIPF